MKKIDKQTFWAGMVGIVAFIAIICELIFGGISTASVSTAIKDLMGIAIAVILIIIVFNLLSYGLKDGLLVSFAELVFSIPAAILIVLILVAGSQKGDKKRKK